MNAWLLGVALAAAAPLAAADAVTDWDKVACDVVGGVKVATPLGVRTMAIAQTAVFEAVNGITGRYSGSGRAPQPDASVDAAVAAASRAVLAALVPDRKGEIEAAYAKALATIDQGAARDAGVAAGERAAADVPRKAIVP